MDGRGRTAFLADLTRAADEADAMFR